MLSSPRVIGLTVALPLMVLVAALPTFAFEVQTTSNKNPASLTARLDVSCASATATFEKELGKLLTKIPYIRDARNMHGTKWEPIESYGKWKSDKKQIYLSVNPVLAKEFPTTFIPAEAIRRICDRSSDGQLIESSCTDYTNYALTGSQGLTYQKVIETTRSQNWLNSFSMYARFEEATPTTCNLRTELYISGNDYLWAKKHLIGDINTTLIEARILSRFVDWSKVILPELEAK